MTTTQFKTTSPPRRFGKWLLQLFVAWIAMGSFQHLQAGHGAGIDITYECINTCTTRVHFRALRSCNTPIQNISPINTFYITAAANCVLPVQVSPWINVSNQELTPVCPGTPTQCTSPTATIAGVMEHYWVGDFDFCASNCNAYTLNWGLCCRNQSITSMSIPNSTTLYVGTTIDPLITPCNSSPVFGNPPLPYICQGQTHNYLQNATDPDGDSLAYSLGNCLSGANTIVPYFPGFGPNSPLGPDWLVSINPITGELNIQPNLLSGNPGSIQVGVVCIMVEEWRNGQLIGTTTRDIQLTVLPCPGNDQPYILGVDNPIGGTANGFEVTTCLGSSICFNINAKDPDPGQVQTLFWDGNLAALGATFSETGNPVVTDTVQGTFPAAEFCWTPSAAGTFPFTVTLSDDHCPLPGFNQYTFLIHVEQIQIDVIDSALGCDEAIFLAHPVTGTSPYSFNWTSSHFPNQNTTSFNQTFPGIGQYPYALSVTDSAGCLFEYIDTLVLANNVTANAGLGQSICSGQSFVMGTPPGSNPNLVYQWSPALFLNGSTLAQPTLTPVIPGPSPASFPYQLILNDTLTNCSDSDLVQIQVNPIPDASFALADTLCAMDTTTATYSGTLMGMGSFQWTFDNGSPSAGFGIGPHQVFWNSPGAHAVSLVVSSLGCTSPPSLDTVHVNPLPSAIIAAQLPQCFSHHNFNLLNLGVYDSTATFHWDFGPTAIFNSDTSEHVDSLQYPVSGNYWVTLQITQNGCSGNVDSVYLTVIEEPDPRWSYSTSGQCFPLNDFEFTANGQNGSGAIYLWSFEDGSPSSSSSPTQIVNFTSQGPKVVTLTVIQNGCQLTVTDTVQVYPSPEVDAGVDQSFCAGSSGGIQLGTAIGGLGPYSWSWYTLGSPQLTIDSLDDDDPLIMVDQSGWVYVQIIDQNGCSSNADSVWINLIPKPIGIAPSDTSVCDGGGPCTVLIPTVSNTGGPYSYTWSPAIGLNDSTLLYPCASPDSTTHYTVVVTDQSTGCSSDMGGLDPSAQVLVTVLPTPIAEAGPSASFCLGDSVQLNGSAGSAGPNYQYQWSPATGLSDPNIASPWAQPGITTVYTLSVFSNGCPGISDTVHVRVYGHPQANAGNDIQICLGESTQLNATAGGGDGSSAYSFQWNNTISLDDPLLEDPLATPSMTTTYHVVATNDWGCESVADSVTVFLYPTPMPDAGDSAFICLGNAYQFQGSYFYGSTDSVSDPSQIYAHWSPGAELSDSTLMMPTFTPTTSGWYALTINHQTCTTRDSVYLTVIPTLNAAATSDTNTICAGDSLLLQATGGLNGAGFVWTPSSGLQDANAAETMASPLITTTYKVYLAEYGCLDSTELTVEVLPTPQASFSLTDSEGCFPHEVFFASTSTDASYLIWDFGDGSPVQNLPQLLHTFTDPGTYQVSLFALAPGGCSDSATVVNIEVTPPPHIEIESYPAIPAELFIGHSTLDLTEDFGELVHWQWEISNQDRFSGQEIQYTFDEPGAYFVTLRGHDVKGCWNEKTVGPIVVATSYIEERNVFTPNGDGINDEFLIPYEGHQPTLIQIFDRWGKLVFESRNKNEGWDGTTQNGKLAPVGIYAVLFTAGAQDLTMMISLIR